MNKRDWIIIIIGGLIFIIFSYLLISSNYPRFKPEQEKIIIEYSDKEIISQIAKNISESYEYELFKFDCKHFSNELKNQLQSKGYDAYCVYGFVKSPPFSYPIHTWVEVNLSGEIIWVESTAGEIVSEDKKKYYDLRDKGRCWL